MANGSASTYQTGCRLTRGMDSGNHKGGTFELPCWINLYKNYKTKLVEPSEQADWSRWIVETYRRQQRAQGIFMVETETSGIDQPEGERQPN